MELTRINKYLSAVGVCSRREADRLIEEGKVVVNGQQATTGMQVSDRDTIVVNGKTLTKKKSNVKPILLMFYKPRGIVCTAEKREKDNVIDYIKYPQRIYPIGRLDKTSEGLLLLTNQGDLANEIMRAANEHEKEYVVTIDAPVTEDFLKKMQAGVDLGDVVTRPCTAFQSGECTFHMILTQGINRQIRRMCESEGYHVRRLKRIRIMNLEIGKMRVGEVREVPDTAARQLYAMIKGEKGPHRERTRTRN